ncbi:muts domain V-domain-containing protein [Chaetomium tenue]|uniref:Muts domain V-domain-containing protein n=1 Tax=Chaetomium tenue TaxID=1854479 RepID=A0ACB7PQ42_9PEZI|nr:muts domain V-domain-containing protein [Chaetomium globosum]
MDGENRKKTLSMGGHLGDPASDSAAPAEDDQHHLRAPRASQGTHNRGSSTSRFGRPENDLLRRRAMSGAMRNTTAGSTSEIHSARPSDRLTRHNLASQSGNYEPILPNPFAQNPTSRDVSKFVHYDGTGNMGGVQPSRGRSSDQADRHPANAEDQVNSPYIYPGNTGYASSSSQDLHIRAAHDSSPVGDPMGSRPAMSPSNNSFGSSPPANIGDPTSWLLPRPFRHEVELPFVGETSYEDTEGTEDDFELASLSSTRSFSQGKGKFRASTPSSLGRGESNTPTIRSPYFQRGELGPEPRQVGTGGPSYDVVNANPLHPAFSMSARNNMASSSGSFTDYQSSSPSPRYQQQYHNDSRDDTQSRSYREDNRSLSRNSDAGSLWDQQPTLSRTRPASPGLWRAPDNTNSECGYGPSVISGPVTQTLTPNTSPYLRQAGQVAAYKSTSKTTGTPSRGGATGEPGEQRRPQGGNNRPSFDSSAQYRHQDSSILSPLLRPAASRHALQSTMDVDDDHTRTIQNRAETETPSILDFDFSSDSEPDAENIDDSHNLGTGHSQQGNQEQSSQLGTDPTDGTDRVVCAISESRSSDMIGVAVINITIGEVDLFKIVNDDKYQRLAETLWRASTWPQIFIVLKTAVDKHKHWNESEGLKLVDRFAWRADIKTMRQDLDRNFYVSCAFSAAMAYVEEETDVVFRDNSLRIRYRQPADTMGLDRSTITSLELFQNIRNSKGTSSTLFGLLNNTLTPQGRRMIRSALFQPSTNRDLITERHEAVEELSSNEDLFTEVRASLKRLFHIDVERSIPWLRIALQEGVSLIQGRHQMSMPSHEELQEAEKDLTHILMVKAYLGGVQSIRETLEAAGCTSKLCNWVLERCRRENTAPIASFIEEAIEQDAIYSKAPIDIRNNRMWAVKAEPNSVLEGSRQMYRDRTNEMHQYVEELSKTFQEHLGTVPQLRLASDNHYYLRFQWSDVERELTRGQAASEDGRPARMHQRRPQRLGGVAIANGIRRKHHYDCQTLELIQRSSQIQRHADIVTTQCDTFIIGLKKSLLGHAEALLAVNEAIAVLDMLCSFAHLATTQNYVRPIISDNLVLKGARHPVVEARKENFVPNDVYLGDQGARFQVVTGGNMSGKSTFIRTVALIQIMAQVGSFVPATYAAIPLCDRLFTRLSTEDKPENNLGTFGVEMTEMNMILRRVTENSLVIIDELGRGTSTKEGLSIALAMSEELIKKGCRVFFATHFTELARILNTTKQVSVLNVHVVGESSKAGDTTQISLPHTIAPGPVKNEDYGLDLSRRFLPERVVDNAEKVSNDSTMDDPALASYVKKLQTEFTIRMNIAADDDAAEGSATKDVQSPAELPTLTKPSEEEVEGWKKKCDAAESRVMHSNMAQADDKKRPFPAGEGTESLSKRARTDETPSTISQPTPINRNSMIEDLRRGACTPTTRAATPSSIRTGFSDSQADSVMHDAPTADHTPTTQAYNTNDTRHRAMSISSGSNYDEEMPDADSPDAALPPSSAQHPAAGAYAGLVQPLEQFQPLRDWYAREKAAESSSGAAREERGGGGGLDRARSATQEFLRGLHEHEHGEEGGQVEGEEMEL